MFGFVSRFVSQFWEGVPTEESKNVENELGNEACLTKTQKELGIDGINSHGAKFETVEELRKVFSGKVTKLYGDSGLVDDEVYFTFDRVIGGIRPKLNCEVHVEASRKTIHDGWKAERVEILSTDWNDFGEEGMQEALIGNITDINENYLIVNYDLHCPLSSLAPGYVPCKGDWIRAEVIKYQGIVRDVKVIEPLREKSVIGTVTSVSCGHGYIDTEIFFSFGACKKNYIPRKGHTVLVAAIESNQGNSKWRAVKVEPKVPSRGANHPNMTRTDPVVESKFMKKLLENKENIIINNGINFGDVILGESPETIVSIRNGGKKSVVLNSVDGLLVDSIFKIKLIEKGATRNLNALIEDGGRQFFRLQINPQSSVEFKVTVNSRLLGEFNQLVVFNFGEFQIGRHFMVNVQDKQQQLLDARTPYHRRKFVDKKEALNRVLETRNNQQWVIPGERPMFKQKTINISTKLRHYEIPRTLRQYILDKMDLCCLVPSLGGPLSMRNYTERFSTLLHAEEIQMELEMREFDLEQVSLKVVGEFLSLAVPGLAEGRPSLLIGDRVILCVSGRSYNSPKYEGFIHEVLSTEVLLKFNDDFHATYDMDSYDVMFFFNRTPLRRCHKVIEAVNYLGEQVLFPSEVHPKLPQTVRKSKKDKKGLFNSMLNDRQRAAVSRVLSGQSRPMPYVLFGPPGTGKTVTLVEAILQIFHRISSSRILACTPSNSAADLIAERLHHSGGITEGDMVRLNAFQRQQNIPEDIENYSTNIEKLDVAAHYRIVICTCITAGQLHSLGLAPGHFTHVIIDEAGQATEPESLVPISFLAGTEGQIILAGDPYQLGAVLRSPVAKTYGLDVSLLERLMTRRPYLRDEAMFSDHGSYDPLVVTKLINNYRSHEVILELPSRLFYHAEMVPCADESVKDCLRGWHILPNKCGFPVLFHGIKGEDLREGNSPSWFNAVEAVQVLRYVQELRKFEKHPVKLGDIGIITPYRKQVEKIRLLLDRLGMNEIKVGSVEEFQGQERLVIIISTVRSRENLIGLDYTHNIGFLSNPKRFNVAITRAQALMIIIGNPHVLVKDTNWRALLQYCLDNKSYIGCDLPALNDIFEDEIEHDSKPSALNDLETRQNVALPQSSEESISTNNAFQISNGEEGHYSDNLSTRKCPDGSSPGMHPNLNKSNEFSCSMPTLGSSNWQGQDRNNLDSKAKEFKSHYPATSWGLVQFTVDMRDVKGEQGIEQSTKDHLGSSGTMLSRESISTGVPVQSIPDKGEERIDKYTKGHLGFTWIQQKSDEGDRDHLIRGHIQDKFDSNSYGDPFTNGINVDKVGRSKGVTPDISMNKLDTKSTEGYRDIGGVSVDKLSIKGLHGAREDTTSMDILHTSKSKQDSCAHMDEVGYNGTDGPKVNICGIAVDNFGSKNDDELKGGFSRDNLEIRDQQGVSRENKDFYGSSMNQLSPRHNFATRDGDPWTSQRKVNKPHIKDKMSGQSVSSSKFVSAIKSSSQEDANDTKINCFDNGNETPTRCVVGCADNVDESSDDDIEEIVYKGEMA